LPARFPSPVPQVHSRVNAGFKTCSAPWAKSRYRFWFDRANHSLFGFYESYITNRLNIKSIHPSFNTLNFRYQSTLHHSLLSHLFLLTIAMNLYNGYMLCPSDNGIPARSELNVINGTYVISISYEYPPYNWSVVLCPAKLNHLMWHCKSRHTMNIRQLFHMLIMEPYMLTHQTLQNR